MPAGDGSGLCYQTKLGNKVFRQYLFLSSSARELLRDGVAFFCRKNILIVQISVMFLMENVAKYVLDLTDTFPKNDICASIQVSIQLKLTEKLHN